MNRRSLLKASITSVFCLAALPERSSRYHEFFFGMPEGFEPGWEKFRTRLLPNLTNILPPRTVGGCIALGNGAFLTAAHCGDLKQGNNARYLSYSEKNQTLRPDLLLFRRLSFGVSTIPIATNLPKVGSPIIHAALGDHRSPASRFSPGIFTGNSNIFAVSKYDKGKYISPIFTFKSVESNSHVAATPVESGDSGGMIIAFSYDKNQWELIGLIIGHLRTVNQDDSINLNQRNIREAYAVNLCYPQIKSQIESYRS